MINLQCFLIPFVAFWFACITGLPQRIVLTNRKPFTCPKCMAFWLSLFYQIYLGFTVDSLFIITLSSLAAFFIETFIRSKNIKLN